MLTNKKPFPGLVALIVCIYCTPIFAAPQFVTSYAFEDITKFPGIQGGNEMSVNGKCESNTIGRFKPNAFVNADKLYNLCLPNIDACNVVLLEGTNSQNCSGFPIGNVVINVYKGVQLVNSDSSSKYKLFYKIVSPQVQAVYISEK